MEYNIDDYSSDYFGLNINFLSPDDKKKLSPLIYNMSIPPPSSVEFEDERYNLFSNFYNTDRLTPDNFYRPISKIITIEIE